MNHLRTAAYRLLPLAATLPILGIDLGEIGGFLKGMQFRQFLAQLLTQVSTGIVDGVILTLVEASFGVLE